MKKYNHGLQNILLSLLLAVVLISQVEAGTAVIVSPKFSADNITVEELRDIFLGRSNKLSSSIVVVPINQHGKSAVTIEFNEKVLGKSERKFKEYWAKKIFSGKGVPPKSLEGDQAIKEYVSGRVDSIGYIDSASVDDTVKVLLTLE